MQEGVTRNPIFRGTLTALVCAVFGGALIAMGDGTSGLGVTMFLLLPVATGFVTALTVRYWPAVGLSLLIAMALCLAGLVVTGLEGIVCVAMASPILIVGSLVGAALGALVRLWFPTDGTFTTAIVPLLAGTSLLGAGKIEDRLANGYRTEVVQSVITIEASPQDVWDAALEFDEVTGPVPLLMQMGLPIPESCSAEGSGVGSERVCRFNSGEIRERVTEWNPPHRLDLEVEEVQLPGRHWLGFLRATYTFDEDAGGNTVVTRTTTVTSTLRPAWYWRFFEHLGTQTEHAYILDSLKSKVLSRGKGERVVEHAENP